MNPTRPDPRTASLLLAALAAPTLAVGLARFVPAKPASAAAEYTMPDEPVVLPAVGVGMVEHTEPQRRMLAAAAAQRPALSPFKPQFGDMGSTRRDDSPRFIPEVVAPPPPPFRVTSIISGRRTVAVIDGIARVVGERLDDGWSVSTIDTDRQIVMISHPARGDHTLSLRQP